MDKAIKKFMPFVLLCMMAITVKGQAGDLKITGEDIIAGAWKAMFGERRNEEIKSICFEGYFHGSTVPNRTTVKRPNLFRNEVPSGVLVFDGRRAAWVKRGPDKDGNPRNPELIKPADWKHFEVDIALAFPAFFDYPSEFKGVEKVNGSDAYKLAVHLPLGGNVTYFIDSKSFLVTRRLVDWDGDPKEALWENLVDGYIDYDGILFPDGYVYQGREGKEKGLYKNFRFNINPEDGLFKIPEELK
ncbi:MAG: hypothetical protein ABII93_02020 [Chrysiogenia bacterium]